MLFNDAVICYVYMASGIMELLGTERRWEDKVKVKLKEYGEDLSQRYFVHKKFYNK